MKSVTAEEMKIIDHSLMQRLSIPSLLLMENAGRGVAEEVKRILRRSLGRAPVVLVCGTGNNGGDGFVAARHLTTEGIGVRVILAHGGESISGDAKINLTILQRMGIFLKVFDSEKPGECRRLCATSRILVDALLGTGSSGSLREPTASLVRLMNMSRKPIVSIDIPSGLDPDTGLPGEPTAKASVTVTMGLVKKGLLSRNAAPYVGRLVVAHLGVPIDLRISLNRFYRGN